MTPQSSDVQRQQSDVDENPYSIAARLKLSKTYQDYGYADLAVGEAYIALLLVDECLGESGEFEDEACEAAVGDYAKVVVCSSSDEDEARDSVRKHVGEAVKDEMYV